VPLLNRRWALFDVSDVEGFVHATIRAGKVELSYHEHEDLAAYLLAECWLLSQSFQPELGVFFSRFAAPRLRNKAVDWVRSTRGRTRWKFSGGRVHERRRPEFVSLDGQRDDRLDRALASRAGDPQADWDEDLRWLLDSRDRERARDFDTLGLETNE
jgi:hypothetical protein